MKSRLVIILCLALAASPAIAAETQELKTQKDKVSYAIGMDMGNGLKKNDVDVNPDIVAKAIKDILSGNKPLMTEQEAKTALLDLQKDLQAKQVERNKALGEKNKKEGEPFLAQNKSKDGVKTLPSGLQYKVLTGGKGKTPKATDTVTVQYRGTLIDGTEFDSSYKRNQPATFPLSGVIKCWTEGLQLMKVGGKSKIICPSDIAYGDRGSPPIIKPGSTLVFEVELLEIQK